MVYLDWLGPEPGLGQGQGPRRMGCMVLIRTFHTAPEQGQGRTPGTFSGPEEWVWYPFFRSWKCALWWILVFFPVPVQVQCERFLLKPYNPFFQVPVQCERFCIILVPVPVPDQDRVNTPLGVDRPLPDDITVRSRDCARGWYERRAALEIVQEADVILAERESVERKHAAVNTGFQNSPPRQCLLPF